MQSDCRKICQSRTPFGLEQEYTFFGNGRPLDWPKDGFPLRKAILLQRWSRLVAGRDIVEKHLDLCLEADLSISGINAEVMPHNGSFK